MTYSSQRPTATPRPSRWLSAGASALVLWGLFLSPLCATLCAESARAEAQRSCHPKEAGCHGEEADDADAPNGGAPCSASFCEHLQPMGTAETYAALAPGGAVPTLFALFADAAVPTGSAFRSARAPESPPRSLGPPIPLPLRQVLRT
jgi:hypothetical protein